ncbi:hypothetical protein J4G33_14750 [Actinotalea sp. BY-33]|uniref:Uncharacterized protein n=1 Tax=Actinotalea soli TaxID=2819234 RepID=A0A939RUV5_9CELL|nr:hypothetical protein [Actinotalea soli]MBO1753069.1 hypothetical protein [Actinotalea soli]
MAAVTESVPSPTAPSAPAPAAAAGAGTTIRVMAVALWGVVGTLLGYGVLQTVIKASALFG